LIDSFKDSEGKLNLVLEYAAGGTLSSWVDSHLSGIPQSAAIRIMRDLAKGLMQIHGQRVSHRDIREPNLLLMGDPLTWNSESPLVKYADFGLPYVGDRLLGKAAFRKDVSDTFELIQWVAEKAFTAKQQSKYIVMRRGMTAKALLAMVKRLEGSLVNPWGMRLTGRSGRGRPSRQEE
jgi:serine/threonine protein kinase